MNKKVLSTVMAGAMLATTVAPAMAYTIHEYNPETYNVENNEKTKVDLANAIIAEMEKKVLNTGGSVYQVGIRKPNVFYTLNLDPSEDRLEEQKKIIINAIKGLEENESVELIDRGHIKVGNEYSHYYIEDTKVYEKYEKKGKTNTLEEEYNNFEENKNNYSNISSMNYKDGVLKVTLKNNIEKEYKLGDIKVDFNKPIKDASGNVTDFEKILKTKNGETITANQKAVKGLKSHYTDQGHGYPEYIKSIELKSNVEQNESSKGAKFDIELAEGYTFGATNEAAPTEGPIDQSSDNKIRVYQYERRQLPDLNEPIFKEGSKNVIVGFKNIVKKGAYGETGDEIDGEVVSIYKIVAADQDEGNNDDIPDIGGDVDKHELTVPNIPIEPQPNPNPPVVVPPTKPEEKPENKPTMEVLAGDDRYETAVEVANKTANTKDVAGNGNLVLVNGNALVDGLAASPLASILGKTSNVEVAPILLTKTDSLPESTKDYIKEVVSKKSTGKVKVYIVGGNAVVSEKVEKELKELGVDVVRSGGSNREETSLKVAELISKNKKPYNTFVVGANGEADAMSIAPVAADREEPIIVSKNGGLSKDGVQKIADLKANATIVGGTEVVSEATEKALKDAKISTSRVAGSNRQKTNAAIIDRYAKNGLNKIVISKDGSAKKDELVDALTATSLAVKEDAPIVLATDKISDEQINALKNKADKGVFIYQIGYGVSNNVLETLAAKIGLLK
ncbi:cell wall-binding repeat-containing protein [Peptacetobacter sp.]|uniref:cell wall-binding repeat-containing protein n=1 Tax=Peptacetobacter sp. TaxID=2991975 RepID=UPI002611C326|nr:cell wall-binding repeat-containing protein [Peptacetobacter sp.]